MLESTRMEADFSRGVHAQQCNRPFLRPTPPTRNAKEPEPCQWDTGSKTITRRVTVDGVLAWGRRRPPLAQCPSTVRKPPTKLLVVDTSLETSHAGALLIGARSLSGHDLMP
jgi:hypothetical protein